MSRRRPSRAAACRLPEEEVEGHGGELGRPGFVHAVPGGNREELAVGDTAGSVHQLVLGDVTGRPATHNQGGSGDLGEAIPPGRVGVLELPPDGWHYRPVERQRSLRALGNVSLPGEERRRIFENQPFDAFWLLLGNEVRD